MFGLGSLQVLAIALAIGTGLGGLGGWRVTKAFDDSRWFKAQVAAREATIKTLEMRIRVANQAAIADQGRAAAAEQNLSSMKGRADELAAKISAGVCFAGDDVDRVRELWRAPAGAGKARAAGRPKRIEDLLRQDGAGAARR